MKIFKVIIIITMVWLLTPKPAFSFGGVVGSVMDNHTGKPVSGATVIASMNTNILQHKKYEKIKAVSDNKGRVKLSGLHDNYRYAVNVQKKGYIFLNTQYVTPSSGNTVILEGPLRLVRMQPVNGRIVNSNNTPLTNIAITTNFGNVIITDSEGRFSFPFSLGVYNISITDEIIPDWCKPAMSIDTSSRAAFGEIKLFCTIEKMQSGKLKITSKDGRFVDNQEGIIYDNRTNIAWSKLLYSLNNNQGQGAMRFEYAEGYCNSIQHADYNAFRLPHLDELTSLNQNGSIVPMFGFLKNTRDEFWAKDNEDYYLVAPGWAKPGIYKGPNKDRNVANIMCVQDL